MNYFQVVVDEATRDKRVRGLKTTDSATDETAHYIHGMTREGVAVKCIGRVGLVNSKDQKSTSGAC